MSTSPTPSTVKQLFAFSGNQCAFPECKEVLVFEKDVIGEICHIEAENSKGPRYNTAQTDDERRAFENLILLCPKHHKIIDGDEGKYVVGILKGYKADHEKQFKESSFEVSDDEISKALAKLEVTQINVNSSSGTQGVTNSGDINITQNGLAYKDVESLFQTLFEANFPKLREIAGEEAKRNITAFAKTFYETGAKSLTSSDVEKFSTPDVQYILNKAEIAAGRNNSEELRKNLSVLLVGRIKNDNEDLKRIIYNEAIGTIGKLTTNQLKILTIIFLITHTANPGVIHWGTFNKYLNDYLVPFMDFESTQTDFQHIVYSGCGSLSSIGGKDIGKILLNTYPFLFAKNISKEKIDTLDLGGVRDSLFAPVEEDGNEYYRPKMTVMTENLEENLIKSAGVKPEISKKIVEIYMKNLKNKHEIEKDLKEKTALGGKLVDIINDNNIRKLSLTSVGIVIAASYCEQFTDVTLDIDIWLKK